MKSSELLRRSHKKMRHESKPGTLIVPDHGSKEMATGTVNSILKESGLKK